MRREQLFEFLEQKDLAFLLELLDACYDAMKSDQREAVFGKLASDLPIPAVDGELLLKEVEAFRRQSLAKAFYAPFNINSKNFMHVPEETREWFNQLGDLLQDSCRLSAQGDHQHAAACFAVLCELIEAMERGDEIVFADELGSWMIPMEGKIWLAAYMTSLAAVSTPEEFTVRAIPLIRRDSYQSFSGNAFQSARKAADKAQKTHLDAEIKRHKIRTKSTGD